MEVAAVHLPSNRYAGSPSAGEAARVVELRRVLAEPPRPDVVAGDMNCPPGSAPYRIMSEAGYVDAAVAAGSATSERRVDYVWIDAGQASRLTGFAALDGEGFRRVDAAGTPWTLSDHAPLMVELT